MYHLISRDVPYEFTDLENSLKHDWYGASIFFFFYKDWMMHNRINFTCLDIFSFYSTVELQGESDIFGQTQSVFVSSSESHQISRRQHSTVCHQTGAREKGEDKIVMYNYNTDWNKKLNYLDNF